MKLCINVMLLPRHASRYRMASPVEGLPTAKSKGADTYIKMNNPISFVSVFLIRGHPIHLDHTS